MTFVMNQAVIDEHICEVAPHPVTDPPLCDLCGSTEVRHVVSREVMRGRMFVVGHLSPAFDSSAAMAFCSACWPRWQIWRARLGYDLHLHSAAAPCFPDCSVARAAQYAAQMSLVLEPNEWFFIQKTVDGQPSVNGSHAIMASRTMAFLFRGVTRQTYYESTSDPAEVQRQVVNYGGLSPAGVPRVYWNRVSIVVEAFESWYDAPRGLIPFPGTGDRSIGLHSVALTGYRERGDLLRFANSWGAGWGDHGYGTLPYSYLERYMSEAMIHRRARYGPPGWRFSTAATTPAEMRSRSAIEVPVERTRVRIAAGENWVYDVWETASPQTGQPVFAVELHNGYGIRMGWTFFRYRPTADGGVLEVPELFVWPVFRRMGIGRLLEAQARWLAQRWSCREIHLILNEADAIVGPPRAAARAFARTLDYQWRWRAEMSPRRTGTAIKRLLLDE